jgi:hypothetical protein
LAGWIEYHSIFPYEGDRADYRMATLAELMNQIAKGNIRKFGSWKFFMPDYLGTLTDELKAIVDQADMAAEEAWANILDAQERAENGNQTTRPS